MSRDTVHSFTPMDQTVHVRLPCLIVFDLERTFNSLYFSYFYILIDSNVSR